MLGWVRLKGMGSVVASTTNVDCPEGKGADREVDMVGEVSCSVIVGTHSSSPGKTTAFVGICGHAGVKYWEPLRVRQQGRPAQVRGCMATEASTNCEKKNEAIYRGSMHLRKEVPLSLR